MNTESITGRQVTPNPEGSVHDLAIGEFYFQTCHGRLYFHARLPGDLVCVIPVVVGRPAGQAWGWDGNYNEPTLTPSIDCQGHERWHGWVRAGRFESC
jgi:hypothetical protein